MFDTVIHTSHICAQGKELNSADHVNKQPITNGSLNIGSQPENCLVKMPMQKEAVVALIVLIKLYLFSIHFSKRKGGSRLRTQVLIPAPRSLTYCVCIHSEPPNKV